MNSTENLLRGHSTALPQLEALKLGDMSVHEQIISLAGALKACQPSDVIPALRRRQAELMPVSAHALYMASGRKPLMDKFSVAFGGVVRYKAWLHAYSNNVRSGDDTPVYFEQFHNHRHGLASLIVSGGYTADEYRLEDPAGHIPMSGEATLQEWTEFQHSLTRQTVTYRPGEIMYIHPDETHRIRDLIPGSSTLVLETPTIRHHSVVYDDEGSSAQRMVTDMSNARRQLFGGA